MSHPVDIAAGKQLRRRRETLGLTRARLGRSIGISAQQVEKYENAENRMSLSRASEFADALDVHPAYFFDTKHTSILRLMEDALRFYADKRHYQPQPENIGNASTIDFDSHGGRARSVLAKMGAA